MRLKPAEPCPSTLRCRARKGLITALVSDVGVSVLAVRLHDAVTRLVE